MPETNFVSIEELKFDEKGLIPAVVVDSAVGDGVEFERRAALDERADDHGVLGRHFDGHLQESMEVSY
ncbi:MAG: hypothetical protein II033_06100, partial [Clostridia bacterium]|nr:hypothetical protein [Clostridia bacterium]